MLIGLYDVDSHNYPNLPLMKISAYHKSKGDDVEFWVPLKHYDMVYVSKIFGDEYSEIDGTIIQADKIIYGGTGFAIKVVDGKEVYEKSDDGALPDEVEHIYPDYSLYPELTKNTAFGFLTRGCPNNCAFCPRSKERGSGIAQGCRSFRVLEWSKTYKHHGPEPSCLQKPHGTVAAAC